MGYKDFFSGVAYYTPCLDSDPVLKIISFHTGSRFYYSSRPIVVRIAEPIILGYTIRVEVVTLN